MKKDKELHLSQRQKEILEIVFRLGNASINDIRKHLSHAPTDGAVRRMINILYEKGAVDYYHDGAKKIYKPKISKSAEREKALKHVVETFFSGSAARTMAFLLKGSNLDLSQKEKKILSELIGRAKKEGR